MTKSQIHWAFRHMQPLVGVSELTNDVFTQNIIQDYIKLLIEFIFDSFQRT